jgi:hypothetical protein
VNNWAIQSQLRPNRGEHGDGRAEGVSPELVNDPDLEKTVAQFVEDAKVRRAYLCAQASRVKELTEAFASGDPTRVAAKAACEALLAALRDMAHVR